MAPKNPASGAEPKDPNAKVEKEPKDPVAKAEKRLGEAKAVHEKAVAQRDASAREVEAALDEQVKVRAAAGDSAAALADDAKAELKKSKADRKQIKKAQDKILRAHGIDPNDDGPNAYYMRPESERVWRTEEYVRNEVRENQLAQREDSLDDFARELRAEARANHRETPAFKKLRAAVAAGDRKTTDRLLESQTFGPVTAMQESYLENKGLPFKEPPFVDLEEPLAQHSAAMAKAARAARAVKVHAREVERRKRSKDADGDGRTGKAEEADDKKQESP